MKEIDKKLYTYSLWFIVSIVIPYFAGIKAKISIEEFLAATGALIILICTLNIIVTTIVILFKNFKFKIMFAWYDFWIGLFYDKNKKILYFFPIPMIGFKIQKVVK